MLIFLLRDLKFSRYVGDENDWLEVKFIIKYNCVNYILSYIL